MGNDKKKLIVFIDVGDTIIDEGYEVRKVPHGVVLHARCVPGAKETLLELARQGYTLVMVADGLKQSFRNTMSENGLDKIFAAWITSDIVGTEKPDRRMFEAAMESLHLREEDKDRIIMVGNNLSRDIVGAHRFGIPAVHLCWSPRYPHQASTPEEEPEYRIFHLPELIPLAEKLEEQLQTGAGTTW